MKSVQISVHTQTPTSEMMVVTSVRPPPKWPFLSSQVQDAEEKFPEKKYEEYLLKVV